MTTLEGNYLYGIVAKKNGDEENGAPETFGNIGIGGRGDEVHIIWEQGVGVVVSRSPVTVYSLSKEFVLTHERVLEAVMQHYTVLPVRYSLIAESDEQLRALLMRERETFLTMLASLDGKKELGVKAIFPDTIYQDILSKNEALREKKSALERQSAQAGQPKKQGGANMYDLIEVGQLVEAALEAEKKKCADDILTTLSPLAVEVKENKLINERMILNGAFLVEAENEAAFDAAVDALSDRYPDVRFKYVSGMPPYNFVNMTFSLNS